MTIAGHPRAEANAMLDAVGRAFATAVQETSVLPRRGCVRRRPSELLEEYGCFLLIVFFIVVCVFAVIGVVSLFR